MAKHSRTTNISMNFKLASVTGASNLLSRAPSIPFLHGSKTKNYPRVSKEVCWWQVQSPSLLQRLSLRSWKCFRWVVFCCAASLIWVPLRHSIFKAVQAAGSGHAAPSLPGGRGDAISCFLILQPFPIRRAIKHQSSQSESTQGASTSCSADHSAGGSAVRGTSGSCVKSGLYWESRTQQSHKYLSAGFWHRAASAWDVHKLSMGAEDLVLKVHGVSPGSFWCDKDKGCPVQPTGRVAHCCRFMSFQHEADPAVQPEGKIDLFIFFCMGNPSCLFPACGYLLLQVPCVNLQRALLVLPLHGFSYVNEDKMLTQRLLTGAAKPNFSWGSVSCQGLLGCGRGLLAFGHGPS